MGRDCARLQVWKTGLDHQALALKSRPQAVIRSRKRRDDLRLSYTRSAISHACATSGPLHLREVTSDPKAGAFCVDTDHMLRPPALSRAGEK